MVQRVDQSVPAGSTVVATDSQAEKKARMERNSRRVWLGMTLMAIGLSLAGLRLYIKEIES
jgi:hypothetical protein